METQKLLKETLLGYQPTLEESQFLFSALTNKELNDIQISALLATLHTRGETAEEIAGAAKAFLNVANCVPTAKTSLDSCGTGGDRAGTINISTAAALLAASQGISIAKHGNRSVSSKTGSADVLEELAIPVNNTPEQAAQNLENKGFSFLFAPLYHPAIALVMPVRRALGVPTLFNLLGPLLNPAPLKAQLMGIANPEKGELIARTLQNLGREKALIVNGSGLDEIAIHAETTIWEINDGKIETKTYSPADFGIETYPLSELAGGEAKENAAFLTAALAGKGTPAHNAAIAVNAGALAYLEGRVKTLKEGTQWALETLATASAADYLVSLQESQK
ncbi:anthranilate phosphoribosyltransferase [Actinomycetaceae bacterium TAE3-ERU4]|nr:anthranilate phosphoribosyltransferase [Actinomycetaceae bacterium TAE3-ERU4]